MIIQEIQNSKISKGIAIFLLVSLFMEISNPLQLYALTSGPSQPEMGGFTPMDTNEMVDMFSGNFHYTIPLMTVPGPNGGYPIHLNYTSGVGMEHEASWVGLGWNLNPGAINRQVRGIPDDFNGEEVSKTYKRRDNKTILFSPKLGTEYGGGNFGIGGNLSTSLVYNTYAGMSMALNFGVSASFVRDKDVQGSPSLSVGAGVNLDSDNGITPSFSMGGGAKNLKYGAHFGYNSKSGTYNFSNQISYSQSQWKNVKVKDKNGKTANSVRKETVGGSVGSSFSSAANLPPIHVPLTTNTYGGSFQFGGQFSAVELHGALSANVCTQKTPQSAISTPAYGFLYMENATHASLRDFNREKELNVDNHSLNLPLPVTTYDIYSITGETMGGSFRAYRSDRGYVCDNVTTNQSTTQTLGGDAGIGYGFQIGVDYSTNTGTSTSGMWQSGTYDANLSHKGKNGYAGFSKQNISPVLYEPFYFKMMGEQTAIKQNPLHDIGGEEAVAYKLSSTSMPSSLSELFQIHYKTNDLLYKNGNSTTRMSQYVQAERTKRTQLIEYKTNKELNRAATNGRKGHHIGEIAVVNSGGERYTYGETLYNLSEKEVMFSIPTQQTGSFGNTITENYTTGNAAGTQRVGKEKLYSCNETPAYAYSYLITSITSADYVDLDGDGVPSNGDMGYWVTFSYDKKYNAADPYKWRFPYKGANLSLDNISYGKDDKGSYNYGTKEMAYVKRIETKTHYAEFYTSPRQDGYEALDELTGGKGSKKVYKLDSIRLFSKEDALRPMKTVVFEYDYSLCKNVPNHATAGGGKLTLTRVYFTYNNSEKGKDAPYEFTYYNTATYDAVKMDRWGNYKGNANYFEHYVTQNKEIANAWSKEWNLKTIKLPSGGSIDMDYESDDYAYVQDRQAMQMITLNSKTSFEKEDGNFYLYFNKNSQYSAAEYVSNFTNNMLFFKIAVKAKGNSAQPDYVQGYVKIVPGSASDYSTTIGRVKVAPFEAYNKIHPVYLLCCQYLKNNRPDILFGLDDMDDDASDLEGFCNALFSRGMKAKAEMVFGKDNFYKFCLKEGFFKTLITNNPNMPSYIRLNVPGKIKYGGGHRVKTITLNDRWNKSDPSCYQQEYYYRTLENGVMISSGVAEYEPMVCAEETALRYPVYDPATGNFFKEDEMYSEVPYGESYFPAPNVGYSKIIVKTTVPEGVSKATSGIQVQEFYTAKDFPISVSQTYLDKKNNFVPNLIKKLLTGFKQVTSSAYSQGYLIELNDMHGKPKSMATYPWRYSNSEVSLLTQLNGLGATTHIAYFYKTKNAGYAVKLDNEVEVLLGDNRTEKQTLGQTFDFIVDFRENHSLSEGSGAYGNGGVLAWIGPIPIPFASAFPSFDSYEETVRSVATTKVIYNTAILEKTVAVNNGSVLTTRNLQWDPYTGEPLLTTVTNDFEQPVYQYSLPAYWNYPNMGAACDNYRAYFTSSLASVAAPHFQKYDKIAADKTLDTLTLSPVALKYWTPAGAASQTATTEIERSRKSNQLTAIAGSTLSLTHPLSERRFPVFEGFNAATNLQSMPCFECTDCNGVTYCTKVVYQGNRLYFIKFTNGCGDPKICTNVSTGYPYVVSGTLSPSLQPNLSLYKLKRFGDNVNIYRRDNNQYVTSFTWKDPQNIFPECLDGTLQASAVEYRAAWTYHYTDAGINTPPVPNKEKYLGIPNIHRALRSHAFVTERKQEGNYPAYKTNIAYDGTFNYFQFFNYETGNATNNQPPWTWTAEITRYSPYNFELENKNALGLYSAALYGYGNSLATAVANNARYYEIGFDGFENDQTPTRANFRNCLEAGGTISADYAHTGDYSMRYGGNRFLSLTVKVSDPGSAYTPVDGRLTVMKGKKYVLSFWIRSSCNTLYNNGQNITISVNEGAALPLKLEEKIDCWQRVETEFTVPSNAGSEINIIIGSPIWVGYNYFDDFRMMPFNATMKSYVYNPKNYRLVAELDENNYATFYNYDEEGMLVQVKKETEKGIMTLKTTRQHLRGKN